MDYQEDELVEVNAIYLFKTDEAIKIEDADCRQVWLPISALKEIEADEIEEWSEGVEITVTIYSSLARKKGLI